MTKEKQIEEMIKTLCCDYGTKCGGCGCMPLCAIIEHCKDLYNAGYRKQSEGEWIYHECVSSYDGAISGYSCSCCNAFIHEEVYEDTSFPNQYCPNCGAKMKEPSPTKEKYFSSEDVRKMSQSEVRANYQDILKSMKEWK